MPKHRLEELPEELLTRGRLRATMRLANMLVKFLINHHGWIHILIAFQILLAVFPILQAWRALLKAIHVIMVQLGVLIHDWGLAKARDHHAHHGAQMVVEAEEEYEDWGLTGRWHEVVRLLVRFHREEDFLLLVRLRPRARLVLRLLEAEIPLREILELPEIKKLLPNKEANGQDNWGYGDYYKVFSNRPPTDHDFMRYLQLWLNEAVPMLEMQALLSIADTGDFGWHRVRGRSRRILKRYVRQAKATRGKTLYHILKRLDIKLDDFEVAGYSVRETRIEIRTATGEVIRSILIQDKNGHGLFKVAKEIDKGRLDVRSIINGLSEWVTTHRKAKFLRPAQIVIKYRQDPRICPDALVRRRFGKYFDAFKAAAAIWGLIGIIESEEILRPPTRRAG